MNSPAVGVLKDMKKLMIPTAIGALAVTLAACGSSPKQTSTTGKILTNTGGLALYSPDGESASNVRCVGSCTSIWIISGNPNLEP